MPSKLEGFKKYSLDFTQNDNLFLTWRQNNIGILQIKGPKTDSSTSDSIDNAAAHLVSFVLIIRNALVEVTKRYTKYSYIIYRVL